jgi:hypothetical protein
MINNNSKNKKNKSKKKIISNEDKIKWIDGVKNKLEVQLELNNKLLPIQKLYEKMDDWKNYGDTSNGKIPFPEANRIIEYKFSNRLDFTGKSLSSVNLLQDRTKLINASQKF